MDTNFSALAESPADQPITLGRAAVNAAADQSSNAWVAHVLGWAAWQRLLAVLPLLVLLWLAVAWALPEVPSP